MLRRADHTPGKMYSKINSLTMCTSKVASGDMGVRSYTEDVYASQASAGNNDHFTSNATGSHAQTGERGELP